MEHRSYFLYANQSNRYLYRNDTELIIHCAGFYSMQEANETHYPEGREDYYLIYMVQGSMSVEIDGQWQQLNEGEAMLCHPQTAYHHLFQAKPTQYYWLHFSGSKAREMVDCFALGNQVIMQVGVNPAINSKFEQLFDAFQKREAFFLYLLTSSLVAILTDISRSVQLVGMNRADSRLSRSLTYLHSHFDKDISISSLAKLENLSVSRFRSLFKDETQTSPVHYIASMRINQAKDMLSYTDMSIKEISYAVGYRDPLYFTRVFKQHTDCSPSTFRLQSSRNG